MRNTIAAFLVGGALLATAAAGASPGLTAAPKELGEPMDQYIVGFYDLPAERATFLGQAVLKVDEELRHFLVRVGDLAAFESQARAHPVVRFLEWNNPFYARLDFIPNDSRYNDAGHYGSKKIGAETAWDKTLGTSAVKLAMIDTGLQKNHEDFANRGNILQGKDFANNDNDPADEGNACGYHGTHTTGTAGAHINNAKGIAGLSQHTILPVKALKSTLIILFCSGGTQQLADSIKYAADQGAHISSNSWGGGGASATLNDAITYAYDRGMTTVAAAGNDGQCTNCVSEPWLSNPSKVIIVSCTTDADAFCNFSSEGSQVDVSAPGDNILSTTGPNANSYGTKSGTSMSTPHVAGVAALLKARNPSWTYAQIDSRIKSTATDLGPAGFDVEFGHGRVNAAAAVT